MANSVALKFSWQGCSNKKRCFSQLMLAKLLCKTLKKIGSEKWTEKEIEEGISKWLIRAPTRVSRAKKICAEVSSDEDDNKEKNASSD
ncbi:hypothetical protein PV328_008407 [Microctonus aethiopoides]|uniref:Uncharacterized protein n=1 Tax=Microctonus aethiopoides TaxID=144406 RepID=A0AA39FJG0_9HYME|nr:hypothetical protein PV328_008407 [Microctonus aethiopoides]